MTTQNLLVELFVEELPPKVLQKLGDAFASVLAEQLQAQGLSTDASVVTAYATPRRLAAHTFNLLDARGAISVTERAAYIGRIRNLARSVAAAYLDSRARLGFPMAPRAWADEVLAELAKAQSAQSAQKKAA